MASDRLNMKHWTITSNGMTLAQAFGVDKGKVDLPKLKAKLPPAQAKAGGSKTTGALGGIGAAAQQAANTAQQSAAAKSGGGTGGSKQGRGGPTGKKGSSGGGGKGTVVTGNGGSPSANRALGQQMAAAVGWTGAEWVALNNVVNAESGWDTTVHFGGGHGYIGPNSAYGIPQALPGNKMASAGSDWQTNPKTQIKWMLGYIRSQYGDPINAWRHEQIHHWY